ncbi:hypothetical protein RDWZM_005130 [Blomia tropicalis]|uniref:Mitochondrial inner membrane protease subunit 2 n=1 Tax=Blomia tropicalis TaxID=40697 RepID=A0A9Q0M3F6_BLOTA|nr:hypothetical protein RDWZM_005130 [Blomia tropicalis]
MQPTLNQDEDVEEMSNFPRHDVNIWQRYIYRFNSSDMVLLSHWSTRAYQIRRGDIVSLVSPKNPNQIMIKRVIGLEGDTVITRGNFKFESIRIPKGHCWVEGDNHSKSMDSNVFGPIAVGLITARAKWVVWPPKRWKSLDVPELPSDRAASVASVRPYQGSYSNGHQFVIDLKPSTSHHIDIHSFEEESHID